MSNLLSRLRVNVTRGSTKRSTTVEYVGLVNLLVFGSQIGFSLLRSPNDFRDRRDFYLLHFVSHFFNYRAELLLFDVVCVNIRDLDKSTY